MSKIYFLVVEMALSASVCAWADLPKIPEAEVSNVKFCLAAVYEAQARYRTEHGSYASSNTQLLSKLDMEKLPAKYCQKMVIEVTSQEKDHFLAEVASKVANGTVDETRTIRLN